MIADEQHALAAGRVVYECTTGSALYGTAVPGKPGDHDLTRIWVEPPSHFFNARGDRRPSTLTQRSAGVTSTGDDARSRPGDTDLTYYTLNHFIHECAKGNPNALQVLWAHGSFVGDSSDLVGARIRHSLRAHKNRFLCTHVGEVHLGYLKNQKRRYLDDLSLDKDVPSRPYRHELIAEYGFDTKGAYHALRVAMQGIEFMEKHRIQLPMTPANTSYLLKVRMGQFTKEQVLDHLSVLTGHLEKVIAASDLPAEPDYDLLTRWNDRLHHMYWGRESPLRSSNRDTL